MPNKHYLTYFILCFTSIILGQNCILNLKGNIKDFHDGSSIQGATIKIEGSDIYSVTNNKGDFIIENICSSKFKVVVSHVSCDSKVISVNLDETSFLNIKLEHHIEQLTEVNINAKVDKKTNTAQETIIDNDIIERYSSLSLGDAIKEIPGVSSINTGNTIVKPVINGLHSSRILILSNNVRLQDQEWGIDHAPNIDINSVDQISVIKGSGVLQYGGDAVGGVIVLKPSRIIKSDTLFGKTIIGGQTNGRGYNITSNLNKNYSTGWFANFQVSYKRNGDFKSPDYNLTNTGLESKSAAVRFGKNKFESGYELYYSYLDNEIGILRTSHIGNLFDFRRAINSSQPIVIEGFNNSINVPKQDIKHHLIKANYYKRFENFGKINLQYDYQNNRRKEFDVRIGDRRNIPAVDLILQTHTILADVSLDSNLERRVNFGILGRYQDNFANPDTGVRRLIPDYNKYDFGIYTTSEWQINDDLIIDAGIRYDFNRIDAKKFYLKSRWEESGYDEIFSDIIIDEFPTQFLTNPKFDYHNISASFGGKYTIDEHNQIILNYSLASRPPNASELFSDGLHHALARIEIGDIRFNKEIANRIASSYSYNNSRFNLLIEVFYNRIKDYIYLRPFEDNLDNRGAFGLWLYKQTNAELFGIDTNVTFEITKNFEWQNKSSLIKGYDIKTDLPLINIPAFNSVNQIMYKNEDWLNFSASLKSELFFEQKEFPNFNYEVLDQFTGERFEIDISSPPQGFHLIHFYSELTLKMNKKTSLNIGLGVNNVFNTSYRNYLNSLRYFADELGRNIILQLKLNY